MIVIGEKRVPGSGMAGNLATPVTVVKSDGVVGTVVRAITEQLPHYLATNGQLYSY